MLVDESNYLMNSSATMQQRKFLRTVSKMKRWGSPGHLMLPATISEL